MKNLTIAFSLMALSLCSVSSFAQDENSGCLFADKRLIDLPKNEISISLAFGIGSTSYGNNHNEHCSSFKKAPYAYSDGWHCGFGYGAFNGRYMRNISKRFAVGLSFGYAGEDSEWYTYDHVTEKPEDSYPYCKPLFDWNSDGVVNSDDYPEGPGYDPMASVCHKDCYVLPSFRAFWFSKRFVALYSFAAVGLKLTKVSEYDNNPHDGVNFTCDKTDIGFAWNVVPVGVEVGGRHVRFFSEMSVNHIGAGAEMGCRVRF